LPGARSTAWAVGGVVGRRLAGRPGPRVVSPGAIRRGAAVLDDMLVATLDGRFAGELIGRDHPVYERARRVWNGTVDRRPALVARCRGAEDVAAALRLARERGLPRAVRGGGHNVAGNAVCDDGVVIGFVRGPRRRRRRPLRRVTVPGSDWTRGGETILQLAEPGTCRGAPRPLPWCSDNPRAPVVGSSRFHRCSRRLGHRWRRHAHGGRLSLEPQRGAWPRRSLPWGHP
jgi:FAD binding domain